MLATEADLLRTLRRGTYTLEQLYARCEAQLDVSRSDGDRAPSPSHRTDRVWKRRLRSALMNLQHTGQAERVDRAVWAINSPQHTPRTLVLVLPGGTVADIEMRLQPAIGLLSSLEEPADLVITDPPYALGRGHGHFSDGNGYRRDHTKVLGGYRDIEPAAYREFTYRWVAAAAGALRPGGQLAVITGPQQSAVVQLASEDTGLNWVSQIVARKVFPLLTSRRPSCAHWTVTVMCKGRVDHPRRVFNTPADLPKSNAGGDYPLDWWEHNGRADRPGLLRYDNALPVPLVSRLIEAFTNVEEHVVDPMLGSGTTMIAALSLHRRFTGGDVNLNALRFSAARLLDEHLWPTFTPHVEQGTWRQPTLFAA